MHRPASCPKDVKCCHDTQTHTDGTNFIPTTADVGGNDVYCDITLQTCRAACKLMSHYRDETVQNLDR